MQANMSAQTAAIPQRDRLIDGDISIELSPAQVEEFEPDASILKPGSRVFLTHLEGKPLAQQRDMSMRLLAMGYTPVPHLAAKNFVSEQEFVDHITAHRANGVTEGLFLGGNPSVSHGPFREAADLLAHSVMPDLDMKAAFIGGYPEGHADIAAQVLADATRRKIDLCGQIGLTPHLISQFAFDGKVIAKWATDLSLSHPGVRVRVGLAGVTSLPKLIKFAAMCGIGPSIAVLKRSGIGLLNALADRDPSDVIEAIEEQVAGTAMPLDLHFFPFGGWQKTLAWVSASRRG